MAKISSIQWTDATWNIARGCTKVDEDCKFCYMYRESMDSSRYNPLQVVRTKTVFNLPLKLKEPSRIFASSLTDFFHEEIDSYRHEAWDIIKACPQHTFQILTKRPERILEKLPLFWNRGWDNCWMGTSCGSQESLHRIEHLMKVPAANRFLSLEPLHGPIDLSKYLINKTAIGPDHIFSDRMGKQGRIHWVIIGGESGNENGKYKYRPCQLHWIENIILQCQEAGVAVFVKQLGTYLSKQLKLKDRHGGDIEEWPEHLRIREFPKDVIDFGPNVIW
jgi:protein gp37